MPKSFPARNSKSARDSGSNFSSSSKNRGNLVVPSRRLEVSGDPDDNPFLECADAARADYLVTGNLRHFPRFWKKTKIITPREFIGLVAPHLIT
jgi:predicted nucleic acid-binding protein